MSSEVVYIKQLDDVDLKIECSDAINRELSDYFSFKEKGVEFHPLVKARKWDGVQRIFKYKTGKLYSGLIKVLLEFCKERGYKPVVDDSVYIHRLEKSDITPFSKKLQLSSKGTEIGLRDYQVDALNYALSYKRGLVVSPTGSGKSLVAYTLAMKWLTQIDKKILVIVPNLSLIHQLFDDFKDYASKNNNIDIDRLVHKVYEGQSKTSKKPVFISTWQSIFNEKKDYFKQFDAVIVDEVHLAEAKSIRGIMTKLSKCPRRIGLTGTLKDSKCHRIILTGLFGPDKQVIKTKKLMDRGELAKLEIDCVVLKHKNAPKIEKYQDEMEYIVTHDKRNKFLVDLTTRCKGNTLVLCQYVEKHTIPIFEALEKKHKGNVYLVYGDIDGEEREWIRKTVEQETNSIIVATAQTFSTGVNIKNLHNVIFASPSKSKIRILQSIGRGLRKTDSKASMKLYDIADSFDSAKNYTMNHLEERIRIYAEQGFEYAIREIAL